MISGISGISGIASSCLSNPYPLAVSPFTHPPELRVLGYLGYLGYLGEQLESLRYHFSSVKSCVIPGISGISGMASSHLSKPYHPAVSPFLQPPELRVLGYFGYLGYCNILPPTLLLVPSLCRKLRA